MEGAIVSGNVVGSCCRDVSGQWCSAVTRGCGSGIAASVAKSWKEGGMDNYDRSGREEGGLVDRIVVVGVVICCCFTFVTIVDSL